MKPIGKSMDHYWRVIGMANATDVNLVQAIEENRLTAQEWANMVETCRRCDWVPDCDRLLARDPKLQDAPSRCANCFKFASLATTQ